MKQHKEDTVVPGARSQVIATVMMMKSATNAKAIAQQLFHQMGRDGVPLDEVSNLISLNREDHNT